MDLKDHIFPYLNSRDLDVARAYERKGALSEACWVARNIIHETLEHGAAMDVLLRCSGESHVREVLREKKVAHSPSTGNEDSKGFFIGGTGRSGTSLLRGLLGTHPHGTTVPGETKCINDATFRLFPHWFHALRHEEREKGLETARTLWRERFYCYQHSHKASPTDDLRRGLCLWLERDMLEAELPRLDSLLQARSLREAERTWGGFFLRLLDLRPPQVGKRFWVEKTPRNSYFADFLYAMLPHMKLVNIVRDGRDVALSMRTVTWGEKDLLAAMEWWARELEHTDRVLAGLSDTNLLTVRYEDLVSAPRPTLDRICEFLGISPVIEPEVHGGSLGRWKMEMELDIQQEAARKYGDLLRAHGYDPEPDTRKTHVVLRPKGYDMKKKDGVRYMADLVLPLASALPCLLVRDVAEDRAPCFFLRHDIDNNMTSALHMAHLEHANGVRASYYFLPPSPSMGWSNYYGVLRDRKMIVAPDLLENARTLQDLGHEVGLHNNFAEVAAYLGCDLAAFIHEQTALFRDAGIAICGSSGHGSPFFHDNDFISYEIFAGVKTKPGKSKGRIVDIDGWKLRLHALDMEDFGLRYEAYNVPYDIGLNDSNDVWGGRLIRDSCRPDLKLIKTMRDVEAFKAMVEQAVQHRTWRILQVLIHPEHWAIR
jgi:hypothetical protein